MKISVIIPIYNVEEYLEECINSVLNQSYNDIEILLVNDGSTDNSGAICEKYSNQYSNIKSINKENGGLSDARNVGINNSTGDYLVFIDSDDFWGKDFLQDIVTLLKKESNIDYVFFKYKYYYQKSKHIEEEILHLSEHQVRGKSGIQVLTEILKTNRNFSWIACRGLIKRDFLLENKLYFKVGKNYEDILWTPMVFLKAKQLAYYDEAIYFYRLERQGQITSKFNYKNLKDNLDAVNFWVKELDNYILEDQFKGLLMKNVTLRYYVTIWYSGFIEYKDRKELIRELESSKDILKYKRDKLSFITSFLCKSIGFNATSIIFKFAIVLKRKLK